MTTMTTMTTTATASDPIASRDYIAANVIPCLRPVGVRDDAVCVSFLDLELYLRVCVTVDGYDGTYVLNRDLAAARGFDPEELVALAVRNAGSSVQCVTLSSVLGIPADDMIYVVRTESGMYSAGAAMTCTHQLRRLCERLQCMRLTLIPSSVHEILALPQADDPDAINALIASVNGDPLLLAPGEVLSDHAYTYDYVTDAITC